MYLWRQLSLKEREEMLASRQERQRPWHGPPRFAGSERKLFHLSAACFEHKPIIGATLARLESFSHSLHAALRDACKEVFAWCVLPNHYHLLVETWNLRATTRLLGQFHGRTSFLWNREDNTPGRSCFHRSSDRALRSERHFWATMNYIHHNPVHHALVEKWTDWPWSSAHDFLTGAGREEAQRIWREYPLLDYGKNWDEGDVRSPAFRRKRTPPSG